MKNKLNTLAIMLLINKEKSGKTEYFLVTCKKNKKAKQLINMANKTKIPIFDESAFVRAVYYLCDDGRIYYPELTYWLNNWYEKYIN